MTMETEIKVMWSQVKEHSSHEKVGEKKKKFCLRASRGSRALSTP